MFENSDGIVDESNDYSSQNVNEVSDRNDIVNDMRICEDQWKMLMNDKVKPKIILCAEEVYKDLNNDDIMDIFQCIYCHGIPIDPYECTKCEVVFCLECKQTNDRVGDYL